MVSGPVMADGDGPTLKCSVLEQPVGKEYTMSGLPAASPVTSPPDVTVACVVLLLLQLPPAGLLLSRAVLPTQTVDAPVMADGITFTVTVVVALHPPARLYVMVAVPGATPTTIPELDTTVAIAVLLLVHMPPLTVLLSGMLAVAHTADGPVIAGGVVFTVIA